VFAIEDGIGVRSDPVAQNEDAALTGEHEVEFDVAVPEDEEVDVGMILEILLGEGDKVLIVLTQIGWITAFEAVLHAAVLGPLQTEGYAPTGMEGGKHPLTQFVVKNTTQEAEGTAGIAQPIAMPEEEQLIGEFDSDGLVVHDHATLLLEVVLDPDVVVAGKEMHLDTVVGEFADLAQQTRKTLGHAMLIFEPKVEDVTQEIDSLCLVLDLIEETHQATFLLTGMRNGQTAQVGIGEKVDVFQIEN